MEASYDTLTELADQTSAPFVGRWHALVSTTNWEKGRIIHQWREALIAAGAAASEYSDEAWSRRLGTVSPQHTGRLRRTFSRFGEVHEEFAGLYWSHFQAAVDWDDAEMWLEGAVQNGWSVAEMRRARYQTLGALGKPPADEEVVSEEFDSDAPSDDVLDGLPRTIAASPSVVADSDAPEADDDLADAQDDLDGGERAGGDEATPPIQPFVALAELPADLAEAFESFKLAILRHKLAGWSEVPREAVLDALDALKQLATAPR
jgi:hypothetical protein